MPERLENEIKSYESGGSNGSISKQFVMSYSILLTIMNGRKLEY